MKTLIAIPCMDMMHTDCSRSVMEMDKVGDVQCGYIQGTMIYTARNIIARNAIDEGFDRVFWIDSDMVIPKDAMIKLSAHMDAGFDVVTGLYFGRRKPYNPMIMDTLKWYVHEDGEVEASATSYLNYPHDSLFEIAGCGFGCVMTSVDILKKAVDLCGAPFTPMLGIGEDVAFCWRVTHMGKKIYCDSSIKCGHVGKYTFSEADFFAEAAKRGAK